MPCSNSSILFSLLPQIYLFPDSTLTPQNILRFSSFLTGFKWECTASLTACAVQVHVSCACSFGSAQLTLVTTWVCSAHLGLEVLPWLPSTSQRLFQYFLSVLRPQTASLNWHFVTFCFHKHTTRTSEDLAYLNFFAFTFSTSHLYRHSSLYCDFSSHVIF